MLSMASIGDLGGPYYTIAPPSPRQPPARRSRPFPSNPRTVVEEMEVGSEDDDDDGLELRRMGSKDRACGSGSGGVCGSRRDEDDEEEFESGDAEGYVMSDAYKRRDWRRGMLRQMSLGLAVYGACVMVTCLVTNTFLVAAH